MQFNWRCKIETHFRFAFQTQSLIIHYFEILFTEKLPTDSIINWSRYFLLIISPRPKLHTEPIINSLISYLLPEWVVLNSFKATLTYRYANSVLVIFGFVQKHYATFAHCIHYFARTEWQKRKQWAKAWTSGTPSADKISSFSSHAVVQRTIVGRSTWTCLPSRPRSRSSKSSYNKKWNASMEFLRPDQCNNLIEPNKIHYL